MSQTDVPVAVEQESRSGRLAENDVPAEPRSELDALRRIVARGRVSVCSYCGDTLESSGRLPEEVQGEIERHILACKKRPERRLIDALLAVVTQLGVDVSVLPAGDVEALALAVRKRWEEEIDLRDRQIEALLGALGKFNGFWTGWSRRGPNPAGSRNGEKERKEPAMAKTEAPLLKKWPKAFVAVPGSVLLYDNRKDAPILIDVSTRQKMEAGAQWLFWHLQSDGQVYVGLEQAGPEPIEQAMTELRQAISMAASKTVAVTLQTGLAELQVKYDKQADVGRPRERRLYAKAKENDLRAIAELLYLRRGREDENWSIETLFDPMVISEAGAPPVIPTTAPGE